MPVKTISNAIDLSKKSTLGKFGQDFKPLVYSATTDDRKREKEERNQKIIDLYLKAENTQEAIAEMIVCDQKTDSQHD